MSHFTYFTGIEQNTAYLKKLYFTSQGLSKQEWYPIRFRCVIFKGKSDQEEKMLEDLE